MTRTARLETVLGVTASGASITAAVLFGHGVARIFVGPIYQGVAYLSLAVTLRFVVLWGVGESLHRLRNAIAHELDQQVRSQVVGSYASDVTRLLMAADAVRAGVGTTYLASTAAGSIFGVIGLWVAGGWLAAVIFIGLVALSVPFYIRTGRAAEKSRQEIAERTDEFATIQSLTLEAMSDMRSLKAVPYASHRLGVASRAMSQSIIESIRIAMGSSLITDFIGGVAIGLVAMVVGFDLLYGRRNLEAGVVALWLVVEMNLRIRMWAGAFHQREDARIGLRELTTHVMEMPARSPNRSLIVAEGVSFPSFTQLVTLSVPPGHRLLVTGPSGVGKTRLLRALVGIERPPSGVISVTDKPIGWVQSSSQLLPVSLRENLDRAGTASPEQIRLTMTNLGLSGSRFEDIDTVIVSADQFSDGERARLAIARALLANVQLMVIDDVAGLFDPSILAVVATELSRYPELAIVEAAHSRRLLLAPDQILALEPT